MNQYIIGLAINKVQTFLFDTIHTHVQEKQVEKETLRSIQRASNLISRDFRVKIEKAFEGNPIEPLLFCSGVYIFYCSLDKGEIIEKLNKLFLEYYQNSQGKQQLRYVCLPPSSGNKIEDIKAAKQGEYSCAVKPQFRKVGNRMSGTGIPLFASLLA